MGTLDLAGFRAELLFDLRNRTDTGVDGLSQVRQDMFINAGYLHVTHPSVFRHFQVQFRYTIALVNGQQVYTFTPTTDTPPVQVTVLRSIAHVAATTDDPLAFRTKLLPQDEQWFQERSLVSGGPPRNFFVQANTIGLSPVPGPTEAGQLLVLTAWREPDRLVADTDLTVLTTMWDEIVVLAARWRAELHLGYRDMAEATKLDFASLINEYQSFEQLQGVEDYDWRAQVRQESSMERA